MTTFFCFKRLVIFLITANGNNLIAHSTAKYLFGFCLFCSPFMALCFISSALREGQYNESLDQIQIALYKSRN